MLPMFSRTLPAILMSCRSRAGDPDRPGRHIAVVDAAKAVGIEHLYDTSGVRADDERFAINADHRATEKALGASGVTHGAGVRRNPRRRTALAGRLRRFTSSSCAMNVSSSTMTEDVLAVVRTDAGAVRGRWRDSASAGARRSLGIPFGQLPVGELRFAAPGPMEP